MDLEIPEVNIQGIEQFLQITVASGSSLEYYGVAELELEFPELELKDSFPTPVIVVNDTEYNQDVPFIIGTNIIDECLKVCYQNFGVNFLKENTSPLTDGWTSVLKFRQTVCQKKKESSPLGQVYCTQQTTILPNTSSRISGLIRIQTNGEALVLTDTEEFSHLPAGLIVEPCVQNIDSSHLSYLRMGIKMNNLTNHSITIPKKTLLCNLQAVTLVHSSRSSTPDE